MLKMKAGSTPRRSSASLVQLSVLKTRIKVPVSEAVASRRPSRLRSMARRSAKGAGLESDDVEAINPEYQERPGNGASIGAWIGDRHLPPVSLGGLVMVDNKPYGMTVHHMLDDPDRDFGPSDTLRCSALPDMDWYAQSGDDSTVDDEFGYELSDTESEAYSDSDITSDYEDDEDEDEDEEEGESMAEHSALTVGRDDRKRTMVTEEDIMESLLQSEMDDSA